jgi:hypothetical protein
MVAYLKSMKVSLAERGNHEQSLFLLHSFFFLSTLHTCDRDRENRTALHGAYESEGLLTHLMETHRVDVSLFCCLYRTSRYIYRYICINNGHLLTK